MLNGKVQTLHGLDNWQGGVTPIATVLRSATAVKTGQDEILILTFDSVNLEP